VWRRAWDAANVEGCWVNGLEKDINVERSHGDLGVDLCYGFCEISFGGFGGEGAGRVVDRPERHREEVSGFSGNELMMFLLC